MKNNSEFSDALRTCALCFRREELCRSHLLPKALYKLCRAAESAKPNPVLVTPTYVGQNSHQWQEPLLCQSCEQLLRRRGEDTSARYCCRDLNGKFGLRDYLLTNVPLTQLEQGVSLHSLCQLPKAEHFVYFALSVVWRAAACKWTLGNNRAYQILLSDRYFKRIRLFLLGQRSYPDDVYVIMWCSDRPQPFLHLNVPVKLAENHFRFSIPGLVFDVLFQRNGRDVDPIVKRLSLSHSPDMPVLLSSMAETLQGLIIQHLLRASRS